MIAFVQLHASYGLIYVNVADIVYFRTRSATDERAEGEAGSIIGVRQPTVAGERSLIYVNESPEQIGELFHRLSLRGPIAGASGVVVIDG